MKTHGQTGTRAYRAWKSCWYRCTNKKYRWWKNYGGRGIRVCARWKTFENFHADMRDPPDSVRTSLERKDNNGNYEPGNCIWASRAQQARNKRNTRNLTLEGQTRCLSDWSKATGVPVTTLWCRIRDGWSVEKALTTPAGKQSKAQKFKAHGLSMTMKEWARYLDVSPNTLAARLRYGWSNSRTFV